MSAGAVRVLVAVGGVLVAAVAAGLILRRRDAASEPPEPGETAEGEVVMKGWSMKTGVIMPNGGADFMDALAAKLSFEPVVTSGIRTDEEQAAAMQAKRELQLAGSTASSDDLHALYKDDEQIDALLAADFSEWPDILRGFREAGRPVSNHQDAPGPDSLDLRTKDRSADDIEAMRVAVSDLGGTPLIESDHMHVKLPASQLIA